MEMLDNEDFKEFLKDKICRGCGNRCLLTAPCCGRSGIFIKDELKKFK